MSKNVKEALLFTTLMCSLMVVGMSSWNLFLVGQLSWERLMIGFVPTFLVAFTLDMLIVGPVAKGLVFRILRPFSQSLKNWQRILLLSSIIGLLMVSLMSFYGLVINGASLSLGGYGSTWIRNAIMALPLNFLVAGPLARFLFGKLQVFL